MAGYPVEVGDKEVSVAGIDLPISTKNSIVICRKINKMTLEKAKRFLNDLIEKKIDINGKYYTKTAKEILKILESGEKNAEYRGIENPIIKTISAERGPNRRRRRRVGFGNKMKSTHIKLVLRGGKK